MARRNVKVGDVVVIVDVNEARCHWAMGRVMKVHSGRDNLVRVVDVLSRGKMMARPVTKVVVALQSEDLL